MKKIINAPERFIPEMLEGIYAAHPDELMCVGGDLHCLVSKRKHAGKVGIATGGGSGHLPLFLGYVGEGMLDGCSIGDVFQSPSAEQMLAVTREIDQGAGVLYIYGNYNGDIFNFDMAAEMADMEEELLRLPTKRAQRAYIKKVYEEIKGEYTPVIRHMTRTQGKVLLKLIDRETDYTAYEILREFRGGFVAGFWQGVSRIFGQDLKSGYDKDGEDRIIEQIIVYYEAGLL